MLPLLEHFPSCLFIELRNLSSFWGSIFYPGLDGGRVAAKIISGPGAKCLSLPCIFRHYSGTVSSVKDRCLRLACSILVFIMPSGRLCFGLMRIVFMCIVFFAYGRYIGPAFNRNAFLLPGVVYLGPFLMTRGVTGHLEFYSCWFGVPSWLSHVVTLLRLLLCSVCLFSGSAPFVAS